ncbi:peptide-methionine (S)-S-oxide reductase [Rasiella sp. SM2506]|uniref:peptide-methionine (S)-S-oxide reductase n=1 Tax=Rasiella sp. SM2506 TaxID=3423914 RepID=UPI003D7AEC8A
MSLLKTNSIKIAFGGGCHWCTEAVFQSLKGVERVEQGYVASVGEARAFSEAVIVHFNANTILLSVLIEIHLYTHKSTVAHSMRQKYRSAIYTFSEAQKQTAMEILQQLQSQFIERLVTEVLPFQSFKASREEITNYYLKNPSKPFCERFIEPKLALLREEFSAFTKK